MICFQSNAQPVWQSLLGSWKASTPAWLQLSCWRSLDAVSWFLAGLGARSSFFFSLNLFLVCNETVFCCRTQYNPELIGHKEHHQKHGDEREPGEQLRWAPNTGREGERGGRGRGNHQERYYPSTLLRISHHKSCLWSFCLCCCSVFPAHQEAQDGPAKWESHQRRLAPEQRESFQVDSERRRLPGCRASVQRSLRRWGARCGRSQRTRWPADPISRQLLQAHV